MDLNGRSRAELLLVVRGREAPFVVILHADRVYDSDQVESSNMPPFLVTAEVPAGCNCCQISHIIDWLQGGGLHD